MSELAAARAYVRGAAEGGPWPPRGPAPQPPAPAPRAAALVGGGPSAAKPRVERSNPAQRQATACLPAPSLGRVRGQGQVSQAEQTGRGGSKEKLARMPRVILSEPTALTLARLLPADKGLGVPSGGLPFRLLSPPSPLPGRTPATEKSAGPRSLPRTIAPLWLLPAWHCPHASQSWQL